MSKILNSLGVDPEKFSWWDLALCRGIDKELYNMFFDLYESDDMIAKNTDELCLSCPVIKMCHSYGVKHGETGVWGGVYLTSGSVDKSRNVHKTQEVWKELKKKHG